MLVLLSGFIVRLPYVAIRFVGGDDEYLPIAQAADHMQRIRVNGADEAAWEGIIIGIFFNDLTIHDGRDNTIVADVAFV
jgi:hypothetical protein